MNSFFARTNYCFFYKKGIDVVNIFECILNIFSITDLRKFLNITGENVDKEEKENKEGVKE